MHLYIGAVALLCLASDYSFGAVARAAGVLLRGPPLALSSLQSIDGTQLTVDGGGSSGSGGGIDFVQRWIAAICLVDSGGGGSSALAAISAVKVDAPPIAWTGVQPWTGALVHIVALYLLVVTTTTRTVSNGDAVHHQLPLCLVALQAVAVVPARLVDTL